ncbi:MAG: hypothetical protein HYU41_10740 [Candidatus Rokubacteria bacterium]|nr:hypothetical protein [Candidatus Rokubacteria bacterium]
MRAATLLIAVLGLFGCSRSPLLDKPLVPPAIQASLAANGTADGRARFREIFCAVEAARRGSAPAECDRLVLRLPGETSPAGGPVDLSAPRRPTRVIVVPGLYNECVKNLVTPFSDALPELERQGYRTQVLWVNGTSSTAHNARQIRDAVRAVPPEDTIILVGHSKGVPDSLEALATYPEVGERVGALVSVAGSVGGSPLGDDPGALYGALLRLVEWRCKGGDGGGRDSLKRRERAGFVSDALARGALPARVAYVSVVALADPERMAALLKPGYRRLAKIDPSNDGQVLASDAIVPLGTLAGYVRADHWAIALPFSSTSPVLAATLIRHNAFPRAILLEALVRMATEEMSRRVTASPGRVRA